MIYVCICSLCILSPYILDFNFVYTIPREELISLHCQTSTLFMTLTKIFFKNVKRTYLLPYKEFLYVFIRVIPYLT